MEDLSLLNPPDAVTAIQQETDRIGFGMSSEPLVGALLRTLAASKPSGRFLELGTGTGVATAWLLSGMCPHSTITSIDPDPKAQQIAARFLGADPRLQLLQADAIDYLASQPHESFDLVFADALPGKFEALSLSLSRVKPGGFWIGDDLLPQPNWPEGHAPRIPLLLHALAGHPHFTITPLSWASGVVIAVRLRGLGAWK